MATLQIDISDELKNRADAHFKSLGIDVRTAVRGFLADAVNGGNLSFETSSRSPSTDLRQAIEDARTGTNLNGPFNSAREAVAAMLED
ncbi:MAG: type II toxin-antitoxin system RelB/DinJ family antitoxin [Thermoguttaceae bacterium]|nr:type II toxin-antitoxin system RelB/DinJ family antitoxin [Thermoguttaceae bacterium]